MDQPRQLQRVEPLAHLLGSAVAVGGQHGDDLIAPGGGHRAVFNTGWARTSLPVAVRGSSVTIWIMRGRLYGASRCASADSSTAASLGSGTTAYASIPLSKTTTACWTPGMTASVCSTSVRSTFSPPTEICESSRPWMVISPVVGETVPASLVRSQPSAQRLGSDWPMYGDCGISMTISPSSSRTFIPGAGMSDGRCSPNRSVAMTPSSVMPYMLPSGTPYRLVKR